MWNKPTKEQLAKVPPLGAQAEVEPKDVMIYLHFFMANWDWWISKFDRKDIFYGFVCLGDSQMAEWGTVSFQELKELKTEIPLYSMKPYKQMGKFPLEVDCDKYWQPKKFSEIWPKA